MSKTLRPSRRAVVKGAAWAVPVVAVASAAPAMALSGAVTFTQSGACKSPGDSCKTFPKGYRFTGTISSTWSCTITITSATFTTLSGSTPGTLSLDTPIQVPSGTTPNFVLTVNSSNSANAVFSVRVDFTYTDCHGNSQSDSTILTVTGTPPDCSCPPAT